MTAAKDLDIEKLNKHLVELAERMNRDGRSDAAYMCLYASYCITDGFGFDRDGTKVDFHKEKV